MKKSFLLFLLILPVFLLVVLLKPSPVYAGHCEGDENAENRANGTCSPAEWCNGNELWSDDADGGHTGIKVCSNGCENKACKSAPPPESCTPGTGDVVCTSADMLKDQGLCTNSAGLTCAQYYEYICTNSQGVSYCRTKSPNKCAEPCTGGPSPSPSVVPVGSVSPNAIACKEKVEPSEVGINNPTVCDRLHDYILVKPNSAGAAAGTASTCSENHTCTTNADCPQNKKQTDPLKIVPETSNWCYGFRDGARCLQLQMTGQQINNAGCAPGEGSGGPNGCVSLDSCSKCVLTTRIDILPFYASNGWDTRCNNMPNIVADWCNIDPTGCQSLKSGTCATACRNAVSPSPGTGGSPPPSPATGVSPSPSPAAPAPAIFTVSFRVAESPTDLTTASWQPYTTEPMLVDFEFRDKTPGPKFVFVEFKGSDGRVERRTAQIKLLGPDPVISACSLKFEANNTTVLNLSGRDFGSEKGTVKSTIEGSDVPLQVREWKNGSVKAVWPNAPAGQTLPVVVTNPDGQKGEGTCSSISQLALGAKVFCRAPSSHDTENVDLLLIDEKGTKVKQKVKIDKEGIVQGLTQRLEDGRRYVLSLKAPKLIRRTVPFTAGEGATNIPNFILPIGDIFPADGGDGKINTLDKAELNRQWIIAQDATGRSGDFNRDSRVNSIDWACMRFDFNKEDDPIPSAVPSPSPSPSPDVSPSVNIIVPSSPSPSPTVSSSPGTSPSSSPGVSPSPTASSTLVPLPANSCQVSGITCGNTTATSITINNISMTDNGWGAEGMAVYLKGGVIRNYVNSAGSYTVSNLTAGTAYDIKVGCYKDTGGAVPQTTGWTNTISCITR